MSATEARRVVTVEKGSEWEDGFARPRVVLQPVAAPSILGLYGFAAATFAVGVIGDYVMWLTVGTALLGGIWILTLTNG